MKKVSKNYVKHLLRTKGMVQVIIVPCKANIKSPWTDMTPKEFNSLSEFLIYVDDFTYYNCSNKETGFYPAYYIED